MNKQYVMGIDCGTGGVRVGIYDLDGNEKAFAETRHPTVFPRAGWAEQNPNDWWNALCESSRKAMAESGLNKEDIIALSVDGTCGSVVLSKENGIPCGPCLLWMDVRAQEEAYRMSATNHPALRFSGYENVSAEGSICKAMWMKKHRKDDFANADVICECVDWLSFMLTRHWTSNYSVVAARWYYDSRGDGYPDDFFEQLDISDILEMLPKDLHYLGDNIGFLAPEAAELMGLSTKTIVGQGGEDASVGLFGLGVVRPGKIGLITGNSHLILGLTENYVYGHEGVLGPYPDAIIKGYGLVEGGLNSSGSIINWFRKNLCKDIEHLSGREQYDILNAEAEKIPIGSDGLIVQDWWQGNRTPYQDSNIRGNIYGLSLNHTRGHIFRALMEGVAYGTENVFESYRRSGFPVEEVYISGGIVFADVWLHIHADVSNVTIHIPEVRQAPNLGTAILATKAAGIYNFDEAAKKMVHYTKDIFPDAENHKRYQEIFAQYQKVHPIFGEWMHETTSINAKYQH